MSRPQPGQGETKRQRQSRARTLASLPTRPQGARKVGKKVAKKARAATKPAKPKTDGTNEKAEVIAVMKRTKGATLAEIVKDTDWQPHTVRSFVSIMGGKGGEKIESSKNAEGERTYRIGK